MFQLICFSDFQIQKRATIDMIVHSIKPKFFEPKKKSKKKKENFEKNGGFFFFFSLSFSNSPLN